MNDIVAAFHEFFEIIQVDSKELLHEAFHLRYRVLCVEKRVPGFEATNYPDELEKDYHDDHSTHILLRHRASGAFIGTARLIQLNSQNSEELLPTQKHNTQFYPEFADMADIMPRQNTAEISRVVIIEKFSKCRTDRRKSNIPVAIEKRSAENRRRFPHPLLALVVGLTQTCIKNNLFYLFSSMDPALNRLLSFYGLQFGPIGPLIEFHGLRRPYYVDVRDLLARMYISHREVWELVTDFGKFNLEAVIDDLDQDSSYSQIPATGKPIHY